MNDYLKALVEKAQGFQWDAPPVEIVPDREQAVVSDAFDHLAWEMLQDAAPNLRTSIRDIAEEHDYVAPAYEDLFNLLHQGDPTFCDQREMKEGYAANHQMLGQVSSTDAFQKLRSQTAHDEWNTAFAMLSMEDEMKEAFERVREAREAATDAQQAAAAQQCALGEAVAGAQDPNADPTAAGAALEQALANMAQAQAALDAANQQQQQAVDGATDQLEEAAHQAKQEIDEENERASAWGLDDGELKRMNWEERRALTARLDSEKLRKLAALVGAFRRYADAERRRKVKHSAEIIADVELGSDITKLIPDEFNRLAIPELEDLFWVNFAQSSLMQWVLEGTENLGQGPIIVVCDESGSMAGALDSAGNTREMWSKAVSLALCDAARRGKRDFIYIGFASARQQYRVDFPGGSTPIASVIEFVEHFFDGGTSYAEPLTMAMNIVTEYEKAGKEKPDVVFITDDDCRIGDQFVEEWRAVKDRLDMTCYGVQIGTSRASGPMQSLCDKTINLTALNANPEGMQELFRTI